MLEDFNYHKSHYFISDQTLKYHTTHSANRTSTATQPKPVQSPSNLQLAANSLTTRPLPIDLHLHPRLMMHLTHSIHTRPIQSRTLISPLLTRRDVDRGISFKEIHRLQTHLEHLARHDGEVLDPRHVVDPELHPHHDVGVEDAVVAACPAAHPRPAPRLIGVPAAGVELLVTVGGHVDAVVGELGAGGVEGGGGREEGLEGGGVDLVGDGFGVDGVEGVGVLDLEDAVRGGGEIEAGGVGDERFFDVVARAVRVPVGRDGVGVRFVVDEAVQRAVEHGVDAQGEDVLVVGGEDARVDDGAEGDADLVEGVVDGLRGEDAGRADFVDDFARLVEHEGQDVLVVRDRDDGLQDELAVADDRCAVRAVVGVLPADAGVLLVDADAVFERDRLALVVGDDGAEVVDAAETVAAELEVVGHGAGACVAEIEGGFLVVWVSWIGVWDVHV